MHIQIPRAFVDMPRWWNDPSGRRWVDLLAGLVSERCRTWNLEIDGSPWHGTNALVVPVRRGSESFALRLVPPGDDIDTEAKALRFWNGRGTVRLIEIDIAAGAMLLERLDGTRSLFHEPLIDALPIMGRLMRDLAVPHPPPEVPSTTDLAAEYVASFPQLWDLTGEPISRVLLDAAVRSADRLAAGRPADVAVDGDLHFAQVLAGSDVEWVIVDPVLLRGDIEFDLGRILWSRLDEMPDVATVRWAFTMVTAAADVPERRARDWVMARSTSYLFWGLQQGLTIDPPKCRRLLEIFG